VVDIPPLYDSKAIPHEEPRTSDEYYA